VNATFSLVIDAAAFEPLPQPKPDDWLANHPEPGQTFEDFVGFRPNKPSRERRVIYFQPLGGFTDESPPFGLLEEFAASFFCLPVNLRDPIAVEQSRVRSRRNPNTGHQQLLAPDILLLLEGSIPRDAFCVVAFTMIDLYPDPAWNFVFGQASLREGVGVYSLARYLPPFAGGRADARLVLRRSCKVLAHETSHMFGIQHCIFYRCLMNGSNHIAESDARPLHLCPVDLRKLEWSAGFDIRERYSRLFEFARTCGFADEAEWTRQFVET
jgi:archaemetzincin